MNVVIFFINIGFYHGARLRGAQQACEARGWHLNAVQLTDDTLEHPWGDAGQGLGVPLTTLMSKNDMEANVSRRDGLPLIPQHKVDTHLNHLRPDVVFLPGWSFDLSRKVLKWAERHKVPAVVMSESKYDDEPRTWWREKLKSWLYLRKFDGALVGGDAHAAYVAELGIPINRIFKGYDAVDNAHFAHFADEAKAKEVQVRSRYPKMTPRPYFMGAFRLMPRKNALTLLEAYEAYRNRLGSDAWDLVICGNGEQRDELLEIIQARLLSTNVHLVGFLPYHEVGHWYGLAQAFIHPALKEQWGLVINEACAAGLPVLCSKTVGAAPDLVHDGVNGFLFDPTDVEEMASCMVKMHEVGNEGRIYMGKQSRRLVAACAPEVFGRSLVAAALMATRRVEGMAGSSPLHILHILPTRSSEYGGPVAVAEAMAEEAARQGVECAIYPPRSDEAGTNGVRAIWCAVRRANIVHIHGLWHLNAAVAAAAAQLLAIPYVITPHGMLDHWALARSRLKKQIYGYLFERRNLRRAAAVHFLNSEECAEASNYGVQLQTFVLPNGVFTEHFADLPDKNTLRKAYPELEDKVVVLFLGRLHPKKGFDLLIPAFAHATASCPQLHLLVAGPDQGGYRTELEAQIRKFGLLSHVTFLGMVGGKHKLEAFAVADFFVLPSHQEGDSVAVKEAMACGLPVLITPACHFPEVQQASAGIVVPPNEQAWQRALCLLYHDRNFRIQMGHRACRFVQERYTWDKVVRQLLDFYLRVSVLPQGVETRDV